MTYFLRRVWFRLTAWRFSNEDLLAAFDLLDRGRPLEPKARSAMICVSMELLRRNVIPWEE